jgi:hypothetical protein
MYVAASPSAEGPWRTIELRQEILRAGLPIAANPRAADRVYALVQGHIVLEAPTNEPNLPQRLERLFRPRVARAGGELEPTP